MPDSRTKQPKVSNLFLMDSFSQLVYASLMGSMATRADSQTLGRAATRTSLGTSLDEEPRDFWDVSKRGVGEG